MSEIPFVLVGADTLAGEWALSLLEGLSPSGFEGPGMPLLLGADPVDDATLSFSGEELPVQRLVDNGFCTGQIVICVGDARQVEMALPMAQSAGAVIIDATSFSRSLEGVCLVHPAVNPEDFALLRQGGIIGVPGDISMVLSPLLQALRSLGGIARLDMNCHLPVSVFGQKGITELAGQTNQMLNGLPARNQLFDHPVAFNLLPLAGPAMTGPAHGDTGTAVREIIALTGLDDLPIYLSSLVTPVFYGQIVQLSVTLEWEVDERDVIDILEGVPNLRLVLDSEEIVTPAGLATANDEERELVHICGLVVEKNVLRMWVVSDNTRTGSVNGAVQLYQQLIAGFLQ